MKQGPLYRIELSLCSRNLSSSCQGITMTSLCSAVGKMVPVAWFKCKQLMRQPFTRQDCSALSEHRTANVTPYCFF